MLRKILANKYMIWEVIQRNRSEGQDEKQGRREHQYKSLSQSWPLLWVFSDGGAGSLGCASQDEGEGHLSLAS